MKRMKLIKMEIKKYKFGEMDILTDDKGNWIPKTESECDLTLKNEKEILQIQQRRFFFHKEWEFHFQ